MQTISHLKIRVQTVVHIKYIHIDTCLLLYVLNIFISYAPISITETTIYEYDLILNSKTYKKLPQRVSHASYRVIIFPLKYM
jgi:hypothetical protein